MATSQRSPTATREDISEEASRPGWPTPTAVVLGVVGLVAGIALASGAIAVAPSRPAGPVRAGLEVPVTPMNLTLKASHNSPLLAVDPTDSRFVVMAHRMDAPDFSCGLQLSGDSGRSWMEADPVPTLPDGADKCYAPEVTFDANGTLYYLFVGLHGAGNEPMGAFITTSGDRGRTFSAPRQVLGALNFGVRMAIDPDLGPAGRLHLVWIHATSDPPLGGFGPPPNPIMASYSDDGGRTFSEPVQVSDPDRARVVAPALALGPDHAVHVGYWDLNNDAIDYQGLEGPVWPDPWTLVLATSQDGGENFAAGSVVDDEALAHERVMLIFTMAPPSLVADDDQVCFGWTDARNGDADVLVRCSHDEGRSWSKAARVNDDAVGNGKRQYLPRLALSPQGRIDAIFYDRRQDAENVLNHVFYSSSSDGGATFGSNTRITRYPSNSQIGQQYVGAAAEGQFEIGNRLGLVSAPSAALAAWTDMRNSFPQTTAQDLFTAQLRVPRATGTAGWARLLGVALIAASAFSIALPTRRQRRTDAAREAAGAERAG